jgi:hypothetical protein
MTLDEFKNLLEIYSGDLSRWPAAKLQDAVALAKQVPAAQALLDEAVALDHKLRHYDVPQTDLAALENRIMAAIADVPAAADPRAAEAPAPWSLFGWRPAYIFAPSGGLLAAALIGFMIGSAPVTHKEFLLDPSFYSVDVIMSGDADIYEGSLF